VPAFAVRRKRLRKFCKIFAIPALSCTAASLRHPTILEEEEKNECVSTPMNQTGYLVFFIPICVLSKPLNGFCKKIQWLIRKCQIQGFRRSEFREFTGVNDLNSEQEQRRSWHFLSDTK
jgi:hypothetical protein